MHLYNTMTGRGAANHPPLRPPSPPDPALTSQPVSQKRHFHLRSFGPVASTDISNSSIQSDDLDRAATVEPPSRKLQASENRDLLDMVEATGGVREREDGTHPN